MLPPSTLFEAPEYGQRSLFVEPDGRALRFADLADRWMKCLAPEWSSGHAQNMQQAVALAVKTFADPTVGALHAEKVSLWRAEKVASGASKRTANAAVGAWRACLKWACGVGLLGRNPLEHLRPMRVTNADLRKVRRNLSDDEAARFFSAAAVADEERLYPQLPLWTFLATAGTRWGETVALTWEDLNLAEGFARIQPKNEKLRRGRWAVFPAEVGRQLVRLKVRHAAIKSPAPNVFLSPTGLVYPRKASHALRTFKRELAAARVEVATAEGSLDIHALRGHATTALLAAGRPLASVCMAVGHADAKTTLRHYARFTPETLQNQLFPTPAADDGKKTATKK